MVGRLSPSLLWRHWTRFLEVTDCPKVGFPSTGPWQSNENTSLKNKSPHNWGRWHLIVMAFFWSYVRCVIRFEHFVIFGPPPTRCRTRRGRNICVFQIQQRVRDFKLCSYQWCDIAMWTKVFFLRSVLCGAMSVIRWRLHRWMGLVSVLCVRLGHVSERDCLFQWGKI